MAIGGVANLESLPDHGGSNGNIGHEREGSIRMKIVGIFNCEVWFKTSKLVKSVKTMMNAITQSVELRNRVGL